MTTPKTARGSVNPPQYDKCPICGTEWLAGDGTTLPCPTPEKHPGSLVKAAATHEERITEFVEAIKVLAAALQYESMIERSGLTEIGWDALKLASGLVRREQGERVFEDFKDGLALARKFAASDKLLVALKRLHAAEDATIETFTAKEIDELKAAMKQAGEAIREAEAP